MVDVGMAGEELFLSHRSYGFLDQVQERVEEGRSQPRQRALRHLAYYWMAVRAIFTVPLDPLRVEVDGRVSWRARCSPRSPTWRRTAGSSA